MVQTPKGTTEDKGYKYRAQLRHRLKSNLATIDPPAAIAQLGERQTEDLTVPGSIPGLSMQSSMASSELSRRCCFQRAAGRRKCVRLLR